MLRTSSYTIYVDLPGNQEELLLVHGYTGAYDRVSRRVATFLRSLDQKPPKPLYGDWTPEPPLNGAVPTPDAESLEQLRCRGYLTELSTEEEREQLSKAVTRLHEARTQGAPVYIFMPTYSCNLRCFYCFQDHMRTNPAFRHLLRTMDRPLVDRIFQALPQIEAGHGVSGRVARRNIGFFGGEPLLEENRSIVQYIMEKACALGEVDFWAVSNGTDLHAYEDLLGPGKIALIQITLDGEPAEHDRRRIYPDGSGSFQRIARNISRALELGASIQVRVNVDRNNLAQLPTLARLAREQGWDRYRHFDLHTAPVTPSNEKTDRMTTMSTWELRKALEALRAEHPDMRLFRHPDDTMKYRARSIFEQKADPVAFLKTSFCSAHDRMYIFDTFADVYACWERTGDSKIRIGRVHPDGRFEASPGLMQRWRSRSAVSNPVCQRCRYLLHCGGGCAILAEESTGKFFGNYCDAFANRFRASVAEAYQSFLAGEQEQEAPAQVCDQ